MQAIHNSIISYAFFDKQRNKIIIEEYLYYYRMQMVNSHGGLGGISYDNAMIPDDRKEDDLDHTRHHYNGGFKAVDNFSDSDVDYIVIENLEKNPVSDDNRIE